MKDEEKTKDKLIDELVALRQRVVELERSETQYQQTKSGLSESEQRFRATFNQAAVGIAHVDTNGQWLMVNQRLCDIVGYTHSELRERTFQALTHPSDLDTDLEYVRRILADEIQTYSMEKRYIRKDGSLVWINLTVSLVREPWGEPKYFISIIEDINSRKQAEERREVALAAQRESDERFRLLVEAVKDYALFMMNTDGYIVSWNPGVENVLGYSEAEIIGQHFSCIFTPSDIERGAPELELTKAVAEGRALDERWHVRKDGTRFWASGFVTPAVDEAGNLQGFSKVMRDNTSRKQLEEALRQQALELAEANRLKDEFLSVLSHELRTPLNAMLGWASLLQKRKFDEATTARALETIERNAKAQAQLIEDLLDVSRIIQGQLRLDVRSIALESVISAAIETVRPAADTKVIRLHTVLDPGASSVSGDYNRLQQVVWNLLANALKFTPQGGRVEVYLERVGEYAQIRVCDTGIGIRAEFLPYVFDRFRQADSATTRLHGGLGLGLAIVRHLVELHGGTVHADSPGEGQGATFTVKLPLSSVRIVRSDSEQERLMVMGSSDSVSSESNALSGLRVLVVDDEVDARELLTIVLEQYGAEVTTVASVLEALEALEQFRPDVLVSDIGMAGSDGYALLGKVRARDAEFGGQIPAMALTAYARESDRRQALEAGFQMHVSKPVSPAQLVAAVANLVGRTGKV